jgi:tetratricopeptide (TPR) repeat protein
MIKYIVFFVLALTLTNAYGQYENSEQIDLFYKNAISFLEKNRLFEANAEFEKIVKIDPYHIDALYHLAIINDRLNDTPTAIRFLQRCVKLNDKRAALLLVNKFHYTLTYADTMQTIDISTKEKYMKLKGLQITSFGDLTSKILSISSSKKEQLQILLLWTYYNLKADSYRFFYGGKPLSNDEAFEQRIGLCEEYTNLITEFCKAAEIPNFKVLGYVKYQNFKPGDTFDKTNHSWNAVYIDSSWVLCDLFWSTVALKGGNSFINRIETNYFLGLPADFLSDHLPGDPIFQFSNYPIVFDSFIKKSESIDTTMEKMHYLNYKDSLNVLSKMSENEQVLRIAQHIFEYNSANPNELIVESYNFAVDIINKKSNKKEELLNAKRHLERALAIIDFSKDENIRALEESCIKGIEIINWRLQTK